MGSLTVNATTTWTCPALVTAIKKASVWGSGGAGASGLGGAGGHGGGGGAYSETDAIPVTPGTVYTLTVDSSGGASFSEVIGDGGITTKAASANGIAGGTTAASVGTIRFAGGNGGPTSTGFGGSGGGGSGGSTGAGGTGSDGVGGSGAGGAGGTGSPTGAVGGNGGSGTGANAGSPGANPGSGGGGGSDFSGSHPGGAGASGQITITWADPVNIVGPSAAIAVAAPVGATEVVYPVAGAPARIAVAAPMGVVAILPLGAPYVPNAPFLTAVSEVGPDGRPYIDLTVQGSDVLNIISADDASFETGLGTSTAGGNCTSVAQSSVRAFYGSSSMLATFTTVGLQCWTNQDNMAYPCVGGGVFSAMLTAYPLHVESMRCSLNYYDDTGGYIGTTNGPTVVCPAGQWTQLPNPMVTVPDDAVTVTANIDIPALGTAGEQVWIDCVGIFPGGPTIWTPGGLVGNQVVATIIDQHGNYVLGASPTYPLILVDEGGSIRDYFAPYGIDDTYTATLYIFETSSPIPSSLSAPATATMGQAPDTITLYGRMGWAQDEDTSGVLIQWLAGIGQAIQAIDNLVTNTIDEDGVQNPGWSQVLDIDRAPTAMLPWLGQFVGARFDPTIRDDLQRYIIKNSPAFARGTPAAIIAAAQPFLAHGYSASVEERDTSPYHFTVNVPQFAVFASTCLILANEFAQCSDLPGAFATCADLFRIYEEITAAVLAAKPGGLVAVVDFV